MRACVLVVAFCAVAAAGDLVHLRNGRVLEGRVVQETPDRIEVRTGAGTVVVPRDRVRLIERGATRNAPRTVVTRRDEWFLVLHRGKVVGWRRVLHTEGPRRVQVEERTVFFRPGGGVDVDTRRVETSDRDGRPLEFLLMDTYGNRMEVVNGQAVNGRVVVQIRRDGATRTREIRLPKGWVLPLPAWSRFLAEAGPGESRTLTALDVRRLRPTRVVLRRDADAPGQTGPWRELRLVGDARPTRALYRPDKGSLAVELNGPTLVAERVPPERVALARRAHAARPAIKVEEAHRFPFYRRPKDLNVYLPRSGLALKAPDAGWMPAPADGDREGLVCSFEKLGLFASLEVFVYPARAGLDVTQCAGRALARLRLTATAVRPAAPPETGTHEGLPVATRMLEARHRGEDLRCLLSVVRAKDRYVVLLGACPERWWRWAEPDFRAFLASLKVVP